MSLRRYMNLIQEDVPVVGMLPAQELASMLPDVANVGMFASGLLKIEQGQGDDLFMSEITELAHAFVSLVKASREEKMLVIEKMMPVQQRMVSGQQDTTQPQPPAATT